MTPEIVGGLIRQLVIALGALAAVLGYNAGLDWVSIAGAVALVGSTIWTIWQKIVAERDRKRAFAAGVMTTVMPEQTPTIKEAREITQPLGDPKP